MILDLHMEGIADFLKGETKPLPSQLKGVKANPAYSCVANDETTKGRKFLSGLLR